MSRGALILDPGVLQPVATLELQGFAAALALGGVAMLPWRQQWLRAREAGVEATATADELGSRRFRQAVVHLDKSRPGTWQDLRIAWEHLELGAALLLAGYNPLGVRSAIKRLGRELGQVPELLANRAHGRVVRFYRDDGPGPTCPARELTVVLIPRGAVAQASSASPFFAVGNDGEDRVMQLVSAPGLFSAGGLDPGTALLLECLTRGFGTSVEPTRLFDPGCGIGPLGLSALRRWPQARAVLAEADARAVACARSNADQHGLADRCEIHWWDVSEPPPTRGCDLALVNPPFHRHQEVDLSLPRAFFRATAQALRPGGVALVVANWSLPYEAELANHGTVTQVLKRDGFKVLALTKSGRG